MSSPYAQKPLGGKAASLAANERAVTPKGPASRPSRPSKGPSLEPITKPTGKPGPLLRGKQPSLLTSGKPDKFVAGMKKAPKRPHAAAPLQTVLGGPAEKGSGPPRAHIADLQRSQRELGKVYAQNHPVGQQVIEGIASTVPGVALARGLSKGHVDLKTLGSEAFNDVSSGLVPVGKAAAIFGGLRGLKKAGETAAALEGAARLTKAQQKAIKIVRKGVPIADRIAATKNPKALAALRDAEKYVHDVNGMPRIRPEHHNLINHYEAASAGATKSAYLAARRHGIPLGEVKGTGADQKILFSDVERYRVAHLAPQQQLQEGLKGSRSHYGREKAGQKADMAARAAKAEHALNTISDPYEALAASGSHLRGKYATIDYKGLKELNPETVRVLMSDAQNHPTLSVHTKRTVMKALDAAVNEGRNPRPAELRKIEMIFGKKTAAGLVEQARQGAGDKIINVLNIPRSLQATADVSGLLRQNLVAGASHPIIWGKNFPKAFDAAIHPAAFESYAEGIKNRPLYPMALEAGIQFTDLGERATLAAHDESFASDYATHIPGIGHVIKASARAYVTTGNEMKMGLFENRIRLAQAAGQNIEDQKSLHQIGQVINAATGRGTLPGRAEHLLPAMNTFMFSPRLMLARLHYLDPTWYFRLKGPARREALRGLFATAGGVTSALYLFSRIPGVHVGSLDPRSSDFGKLKINNTRVDLAGGFQQYVRLAAELATNTQVSSTTGKKTTLGSGFGVPTRLDVGFNFGLNKLAPAPGLGVNLLRGHDAVGHPITGPGLMQTYLTPLTFQDAKDIYNEKHGGIDGISWAMGAYGLSSLGVGLQTYGPQVPKTRPPGASYDPYTAGSSVGGSDYAQSGASSGSDYAQLP